jgi:hypothetical protein
MQQEFFVWTEFGVYRVSLWQHADLSYTLSGEAVAYTIPSP